MEEKERTGLTLTLKKTEIPKSHQRIESEKTKSTIPNLV